MAVAPPPEHPSDRSSLKDHQQFIDDILHDKSWSESTKTKSFFDKLPAEILHQILSYLPAQDLARVSITCHVLAEHGSNDRLWANLVNSHLPFPISDPGPFDSFRRLYLAHISYWFIPQYKIWFADNEHTGNIILARYDNRRGVIEAYRLVADRGAPQLHLWLANPEVMIQAFDPTIALWLDDPVLFLKDPDPSDPTAAAQAWMAERRMSMAAETQYIFSSLLLCPPELPRDSNVSSDQVWPPRTIPTDKYVLRETAGNPVRQPKSPSQVSEAAFRVRRWTNFRLALEPGHNEALLTYATLDPSLYTPTKEKPYQGIWVGDYSAHGCEFLLVLQRERSGPPDSESGIVDRPSNEGDIKEGTEECHDQTSDNKIGQSGGLVAIKLTGDPNVPRGEVTFVANDIGPGGLLRVADEAPFEGARIVRCTGHVAGIGFRDDTFIASQLILISPDYMGHYWEEMGHVSYYRRVDIDALLQT
ncbi:uncharacterized protein N7459_008824 [Penicillium hispanicum]|uniref:uncharacterized protein n=1 Tax=Penicillium hispanicum TaxID=1080232 RepID=UPI002541966F|nr:uncharacterized protein N7459_008824 [Penicillium hispanicum]KAJ5574397.1 hypothetical protein N7459_008824 [Penicillium hispanicum]